MADTTRVLKVARIVRRQNSVDGNPTFRIHFAEGVYFDTAKDSTLGYEITQSMEGKTFAVEVSGIGRITGMAEVKEEIA